MQVLIQNDEGEVSVTEAVSLDEAFEAVERVGELENDLSTFKATLKVREAQLAESNQRIGRVTAFAADVLLKGAGSVQLDPQAFFAALRDFLTYGDGDISRALPGVSYAQKWGIEFPKGDLSPF
jgi:hypothetical protein